MKVIITNQKELDSILINYNMPHIPCKKCNNSIWYPQTKVILSNESVILINSNYQTVKKVNSCSYQLQICYNCLIDKFPEIESKNPSKLFNTCSKYVKYAFDVSDDDFNNQRKKHGITLNNLIKLYGETDGTSRWNKYCEIQRVTNTFEYKKKHYNFTEEDFSNFNKSRGITLNNLIKKYGEVDGQIRWKKYIDLQKLTKSLEYYIDKYGKDEGTQKWISLGQAKSQTLCNYIKRHGEDIGSVKFKEYLDRFNTNTSKVSQIFFNKFDLIIAEFNLTTYYHSKNKEFSKVLKTLNKYCKIDYYIKELNLAIEYNGDYWHANPNIYLSKDIIHSNLTASDIWNNDMLRKNALLNEHNIETLIVWQTDDFLNTEITLNTLYDEIKNRL